MSTNHPLELEKPAIGDEVVQQIKNNSPPSSGNDDEEGKMVMRRPGKSRRTTRRVTQSIVGPTIADSKLPLLMDCIPNAREELFIKKIELCCTTFDFYDTQNYLEDKAVKLQTMEELIIYTTPDSDIYFSETVLKTFMRMIQLNLLRSPDLTLTREEEIFGICDEDENILELIWHNLQPVYQLFLNIVVHKNLDINQAKRQFNIEFISRFTDLFDRDDAREREYVKTLLHRMYGRFLSYRSMIRRMMAHRFYEAIYEGRSNRGIAEMLEFLGSIINGFATPLKSEHVRFLEVALIPLLKSYLLPTYLLELMYCLTQFVEKDPNTAISVIRGLRRYWPTKNTGKQLMFLQLVEEVLNLCVDADSSIVRLLFDPLCEILCLGLSCPAFAVLERSCELWASEFLCEKFFMKGDIAFTELLPRVYRTLLHSHKTAWSPPAEFLTMKVISMYQELDPKKFAAVDMALKELHKDEDIKREQAEGRWQTLLAQAEQTLPAELLREIW